MPARTAQDTPRRKGPDRRDLHRAPGDYAAGPAPVRAFVIEGPGRGVVREVEPPIAPATARSSSTSRGSACAAPTSSCSRARWPTSRLGRGGVPAADRARVVRHRAVGRAGRRRGLGRAARHRRHDARLRPLRPLPRRPAAPVRGPVRGRDPERLAGRAGRAAGGAGDVAPRSPRRVDDTAGALVEPGGNAWRARGGGRGRRPASGCWCSGAGHDRAAGRADGARPGVDVHLVARREPSVAVRAVARLRARLAASTHARRAVRRRRRRVQRRPSCPALAVDLVEPGGASSGSASSGRPSLVDSRRVVLKDVTVDRDPQRARPASTGALDLFASGRVDPAPLVAAVVGLDEVAGVLGGRTGPRLGRCPEGPRRPAALTIARESRRRMPIAVSPCARGLASGRRITHSWRSNGRRMRATMAGNVTARSSRWRRGRPARRPRPTAAAEVGVEDLEAGRRAHRRGRGRGPRDGRAGRRGRRRRDQRARPARPRRVARGARRPRDGRGDRRHRPRRGDARGRGGDRRRQRARRGRQRRQPRSRHVPGLAVRASSTSRATSSR